MKRLAMIFIVASILCSSGCAGWTLNGYPMENFKNMIQREAIQLAAGIPASFLIHWLGHVAYFEAAGFEWEQDGLNEKIRQPLNANQRGWAGRSGFLAQLLAGAAMKYGPWDFGYFEKGFHLGTMMEIATYPVLHPDKSDLHMIGENKTAEWATYTALSATMLLDHNKRYPIVLAQDFDYRPKDRYLPRPIK